MKSKPSPFFKEIHRLVIRNLTFKIVLENKHSSFHPLVTPNWLHQSQSEQKRYNETDRTNYHIPTMKEQLTTAQKQNKKQKKSNNTATMISLAQKGQRNGCESVRNDVIFNSHLGSGEALHSTSPASCKTPAISIDSNRPNNHWRGNKKSW